jgi:hypothetical protein
MTSRHTIDPATPAAQNRSRLRVRRSLGSSVRNTPLGPHLTNTPSLLEAVRRDPFMASPDLVTRSRRRERAQVTDICCRRTGTAPNRR